MGVKLCRALRLAFKSKAMEDDESGAGEMIQGDVRTISFQCHHCTRQFLLSRGAFLLLKKIIEPKKVDFLFMDR